AWPARCGAGPVAVTIDGFEYGFHAPSSVAAGRTTIHFDNTGKEAHEMILARLNDGVTVDQALAAEDPSTVVSGLQTVNAAPGASADLSADLTTGTWVVVCFL